MLPSWMTLPRPLIGPGAAPGSDTAAAAGVTTARVMPSIRFTGISIERGLTASATSKAAA